MTQNIVYKTKSNLTNEKITLEWHDLVGKRIPDLAWKQVHIVGNYNGKVVLVYLEKIGLYHLPGGHVEVGEDVETTMRRELAEETGGIIIEWEPLGYQIRTDAKGNVDYQLRVYAKVSGIKPENVDFDGSIVPTKLVEIDEMNKVLGWENPIGEHIYHLVRDKFVIASNLRRPLLHSPSRSILY
jgi:8-oxo-dGTP pyrophosphatase MutT (NUDIX family)